MLDRVTATVELYRKPAVRDGDRYCAPWCGRGCTIQEHDRAQAIGLVMRSQLYQVTGLDWEKRVFENLGWHAHAEFGRAQVYPIWTYEGERRIRGYNCIINAGGNPGVSVVGQADTAVAAFLSARDQLRNALVEVGRSFATLGGFE